MQRILCFAILLALAASLQAAQTAQSFARTTSRAVSYRYWLSLPESYRPGSGPNWPVIIFLHGSGECGSDLNAVLRQGIPKLLAAAPPPTDDRTHEATQLLREQFIVVSPQCPENTGWDDDAVLGLLDDVLARHDGDPKRVYLTGLSLGGYATWTIGLRHPERFAAIVPIAGGGSFGDVYGSSRSKDLAIWAFHGAQDGLVPVDESQRMINLLNNVGAPEVKLTIYPDAEHDAWTRTYTDPNLYRWLLWHHR